MMEMVVMWTSPSILVRTCIFIVIVVVVIGVDGPLVQVLPDCSQSSERCAGFYDVEKPANCLKLKILQTF